MPSARGLRGGTQSTRGVAEFTQDADEVRGSARRATLGRRRRAARRRPLAFVVVVAEPGPAAPGAQVLEIRSRTAAAFSIPASRTMCPVPMPWPPRAAAAPPPPAVSTSSDAIPKRRWTGPCTTRRFWTFAWVIVISRTIHAPSRTRRDRSVTM